MKTYMLFGLSVFLGGMVFPSLGRLLIKTLSRKDYAPERATDH